MQSTDRPATKRLAYAPGLDGLRAVACLAVILYHVGILHITAGYLGVTVFFTLSGYLITALLLDELRATGTVDLRGFWRRRVYRIIPLFWTVSAAAAAWGLIDGTTGGWNTVRGAAASLTFMVNWFMVPGGDFAGALGTNWSVAVEEQFYLVWPVLLILLYRRVRSEWNLAVVIGVAATASIAYSWFVSAGADGHRIWFATDMHVGPLLLGCAVAAGLRCRSKVVAAGAGLILIMLMLTADQSAAMMRLAMPAAALCTTLLLPTLQQVGGFLASRPLVAIGRRSYGLYLWGGAIEWIMDQRMGMSGMAHLVVVLAVTFALAEATYRFVEMPMRAHGRKTRQPDVEPVEPVRPVQSPLAA